jgi:hypothetical protein
VGLGRYSRKNRWLRSGEPSPTAEERRCTSRSTASAANTCAAAISTYSRFGGRSDNLFRIGKTGNQCVAAGVPNITTKGVARFGQSILEADFDTLNMDAI